MESTCSSSDKRQFSSKTTTTMMGCNCEHSKRNKESDLPCLSQLSSAVVTASSLSPPSSSQVVTRTHPTQIQPCTRFVLQFLLLFLAALSLQDTVGLSPVSSSSSILSRQQQQHTSRSSAFLSPWRQQTKSIIQPQQQRKPYSPLFLSSRDTTSLSTTTQPSSNEDISSISNGDSVQSNKKDNARNAYQYQSSSTTGQPGVQSDISQSSSLLSESLSSESSPLVSKQLTGTADFFLNEKRRTDQSATSRRLFFASSLLAAGTAMATASVATSSSTSSSSQQMAAANSRLPWEVTPVNKRTGVTVFEAESQGYNVRFVTYLTRFLLCFDADCQRWWYTRAQDIPRTASFEKVNELRLQQFAAFSASVEVGLQEYKVSEKGQQQNVDADGRTGPQRLLQNLLNRYCPDIEQLKASRGTKNLPPLSEKEELKLVREIKEARRQIALLFGLMEVNQPTADITKLLAAIDNGSIASVRIKDPGSGYAPGYGPPEVTFPPPDAGESFETATGRAVLRPNGKLLRIDVVNRGMGYNKPPVVTISPPAAIRFAPKGDDGSLDSATAAQEIAEYGRTAEAKAFLFRSGPNKGRIKEVQLTDPGAGYNQNEIVRVRFTPPELSAQDGGVTATGTAVLELEVGDIYIVNNGTGYAVEKPIPLQVEPPPLTARVNMNDPLMQNFISPNQKLPATTIPTKEMLKKMGTMNSIDESSSRSAKIRDQAGKASLGCIGRGCYDKPVQAVAYARAEVDSYNEFRTQDDILSAQRIETALDARSAKSAATAAVDAPPVPRSTPRISAATSGPESGQIDFLRANTGGASTTSAQLLSLLPAGIGLEFNSAEGRYQLAVDPEFFEDDMDAQQQLSSSSVNNNRETAQANSLSGQFLESKTVRAVLDPDFGPRGRSPIERDMKLGVSSYLRFVASGAICCSGVHLALTPIDVVKTKVQTDPKRYPGVIKAFNRLVKEEGLEGFFQGWAPTFLGFFVWGGVSYALTEFLRRTFTEVASDNGVSLEILIVLLASGIASFFGSFILCPFEAVRIRSVAQPDFGSNIVQVFNRMVKEEGIESLFNAVPAFLLKEIPFAMAKFTVFDITTAMLYENFPAAREDVQLSLLVSLFGGILGGFCAAIVSNPADVTISEMKKAKSDMGPRQAAELVLERGGPAGLFRGLPLRLVFYAMIVSLQFLVYDAVRIALGIGTDDLKLYLDVLGGALSESGGPV